MARRGSRGSSGSGNRYDLGPLHQYDADKVKKRVMTDDEHRGEFPRVSVPSGDFDDILGGGLPYGLTTFYGEGGSGKSKMAGEIARAVAGQSDQPVVYAAAEAITDVPEHRNIIGLDFTKNKPKYNKAVDYLLGFCQDKQPKLLVVDSATKMFSKTDKAVEEADVRSGLGRLAETAEDNFAIIATSEVRGKPGWEYPAGGMAVAHACMMLVRLYRREASNMRESQELGEPVGSVTWTMSVEKDRENRANTESMFKPEYTRRGLRLKKWESAAPDSDDVTMSDMLDKIDELIDAIKST